MINILHYLKIQKIIFSEINIDSLRLQINNQTKYISKNYSGLSELTFINSKSLAEYEVSDNFFEFKFVDKLQNPEFSYEGKFNLKPFYSNIKF